MSIAFCSHCFCYICKVRWSHLRYLWLLLALVLMVFLTSLSRWHFIIFLDALFVLVCHPSYSSKVNITPFFLNITFITCNICHTCQAFVTIFTKHTLHIHSRPTSSISLVLFKERCSAQLASSLTIGQSGYNHRRS